MTITLSDVARFAPNFTEGQREQIFNYAKNKVCDPCDIIKETIEGLYVKEVIFE